MLSAVVCGFLFVWSKPIYGQEPEFEGGFLPVIAYSKPLSADTNNVKRDAGDQTLYRKNVRNQGNIADEKDPFVVPVGFAEDRPVFDFSVPLQENPFHFAGAKSDGMPSGFPNWKDVTGFNEIPDIPESLMANHDLLQSQKFSQLSQDFSFPESFGVQPNLFEEISSKQNLHILDFDSRSKSPKRETDTQSEDTHS